MSASPADPQVSPPPERYESIARWLRWIGFSLPPVCILVYFGVFFVWRHESLGESDTWGHFGEFISGVAGTFLAAATLVALAWTLGLQARELQAARLLSMTQSEAMHRQAFESTFFQLLHRFTEIANRVRSLGLFNRLQQALETKMTSQPGQTSVSAKEAYDLYYMQYPHELGPYFRTFFHVIKFVDTSDLNAAKKADYTSLARAQLGSDELFMQFVNAAFGDEGRTGMRPLIQKYGLLKHARTVKFPGVFEAMKFTAIGMNAYRSRAERELAVPSAT